MASYPPKNKAVSHSINYIPALDGIRAIAIIGVLMFHALPDSLQGGYSGVDVFYVLSGYLISSVILHDIRGGKFSMREFYLRRVQRLLPNALLTILFTFALSMTMLLASQTKQTANHGLWALFSLSNVYIWKNFGGYWGDVAASAPLLHTWSLAVEEQFYILFPATLLFLSWGSHVFKIAIAILLASLSLCVYETWAHPTMAFYMLPTRAWEPLMGAGLAIFMVPAKVEQPLRRIKRSPFTEFMGWTGLATILAAFLLIKDASHFPGIIALIPTIGTLAVVISVADGQTGLARLLSRPFPVLVGKLSYSLYLWHWPLIVIGREYAILTGRSKHAWMLIGAAIGIILAVIAYWTVEQPLRQRGPGRRQRLWIIAMGFATCILASLFLSRRHVVADPDRHFNRVVFRGLLYTTGLAKESEITGAQSTRYYDVQFPLGPQNSPAVWLNGGVVHSWGGGKPRIVIFGSSHALMYSRLIDDICKEHGISVAFLSADASTVFFPTTVNPSFPTSALAQSFDESRRRWVSEWHPDAVFVIDRWDINAIARGPAQFDQSLRELFGELTPHTRKVIVLSQVPVLGLGQDINLREYANWYLRKNGQFPHIAPDDKETLRRSLITRIQTVVHNFSNVQLLRVDQPFYMKDGSVRYLSGRDFIYADDDHLSDAGTELARDAFTQAIIAATIH